jgi:filamentous hemagglutinin
MKSLPADRQPNALKSRSARGGGGCARPTPVGNVAATIQAPNLNITSGGQIQNVGDIFGTQVQMTGQKPC